MNEQDRDVSELFASVREAPVSSRLQRQLENRLTEFRSRLPRAGNTLPADRAGAARRKHHVLVKVAPLVGGVAAAAVLIAVFFSASGATPVWAEVAARVQSMNWVHFDGIATDGAQLEYWVSLKERKLAVKRNGTVFFDDAQSRTRYEFKAGENVIERSELGDTSSLYEGFAELFSAVEHGKNLAGQQPRKDARRVVIDQKRRDVTVEGQRYLEYEFTFDDPQGAVGPSRSVYRVDPETKLPVQLRKWTDLQDEDHYTFAISYPATGPADIYSLGVPKVTPVVPAPEAASKPARSQHPASLNDAGEVDGESPPGSAAAIFVEPVIHARMKSVVQIRTTHVSPLPPKDLQHKVGTVAPVPGRQHNLSTGFVVDEKLVLTLRSNLPQADRIEASFDGRHFVPATLLGYEHANQWDSLALLKVSVSPSSATPIQLDKHGEPDEGQRLVIIGNNFGGFHTVCRGKVTRTSAASQPGVSSADCFVAATGVRPGSTAAPGFSEEGDFLGIVTALSAPPAIVADQDNEDLVDTFLLKAAALKSRFDSLKAELQRLK